MKNIISIDVDTDRTPIVMIGKPTSIPPPTTEEEAKLMILNDISVACEGLCTLIHIADQSKYGDKVDLIKTSIKYLNDMLVEPTIDEVK